VAFEERQGGAGVGGDGAEVGGGEGGWGGRPYCIRIIFCAAGGVSMRVTEHRAVRYGRHGAVTRKNRR
jgi:hypothetical protein